jgi:hypothetical protein
MVNAKEKKMSATTATIAKATRVFTKARKHLGVDYPAEATEYLVAIEKNKSIAIFREQKDGTVAICRKFVIGDVAEYDSYNLSYCGEIESISDKTVTIVKVRGVSNTKHRLDLNTFCWRNFGFDLEKTRESNRIESMNL